jgi:hypothetical protein
MWDLWWTKWHWDRFFSELSVFPCQFHSTGAQLLVKLCKKTAHLHHRVAQKALRLWCVRSICCGALHHVKKTPVLDTSAGAKTHRDRLLKTDGLMQIIRSPSHLEIRSRHLTAGTGIQSQCSPCAIWGTGAGGHSTTASWDEWYPLISQHCPQFRLQFWPALGLSDNNDDLIYA